MKKANAALQSARQSAKLAEKVKDISLPTHPLIKFKKEPTASTAPIVMTTQLNTSADDEERIYKCEQAGCFSSFKSKSSLRDHQKGLNSCAILFTYL